MQMNLSEKKMLIEVDEHNKYLNSFIRKIINLSNYLMNGFGSINISSSTIAGIVRKT